VHSLFLVYFVNFINEAYMLLTSAGPSPAETTVFMRHLVLVTLYSWLSGKQDGMKVSHKYSCSSFWLDLDKSKTCRGYKQNWRNMLRRNCASTLYHLQDYSIIIPWNMESHSQNNTASHRWRRLKPQQHGCENSKPSMCI